MIKVITYIQHLPHFPKPTFFGFACKSSILLFVDVIPEFHLLLHVMLMDGQITLAQFKQSPSASMKGMSSVSPLSRRKGHPGGCLESRFVKYSKYILPFYL